MVQPIQRVNVDVTASMLEELDKAAQDLNVSRQAVIKTLVGETEEEALANLKEAIELHFEAPQATRIPELRVIEVEVGAA